MFLKVTAGVAVIASIICQIWGDEKMLGPANVLVKHVQQCPDPELYPYPVKIERKKISRTQDMFSGNATIDKPMDELMGMSVNVNKYGDGGWKNYYVMEMHNACDFFMGLSRENFKTVLEMLDAPQECPVAAGSYSLQNYTMDYSQLPENLTYGSFEIDLYLTDASVANKRMLCIRSYVEVIPKKED